MSSQVTGTVDVTKGAVCYALDKFSIGAGARKRVQTLRDELAALGPTFDGLAECFGEFLLPHFSKKKATRQVGRKIVTLKVRDEGGGGRGSRNG